MQLPYYKTQKSFDRFVSLIQKALEIYPAAFAHVPDGLALETFASRFNYAVKSGLEFGYDAGVKKQGQDVFKLIGSKIKCVMRNGHVLIGTREGIAQEDAKTPAPATIAMALNVPQAQKAIVLFKGQGIDIQTLCSMIQTNLFVPSVTFKVRIETQDLADFEASNDLLFEPVLGEPNHYLIL